MKDKICFSRTIAYLIIMAAIVVGAFYTTNYLDQKKITTDSKASEGVFTKSNDCNGLANVLKGEESFCFNKIIASGPSAVIIKYAEIRTNNKYSSVKKTDRYCDRFASVGVYGSNYWGKCVVLTKTKGVTVGNNSVSTAQNLSESVEELPATNCTRYNLVEPSSTENEIKNYCKNLYGTKYQYGGGWGSNALCYSRSKTCATSPLCETESCLRCLNERVDVMSCIKAKVAPTNTLSSQTKCPPDGKIKYGWGEGNKCYTLNGLSKTRDSGEPYCANAVVSDSFCCEAGLYQASKCPRPPTPTGSANKPKNCLPFKCRSTNSSYLNLTYYYMNNRYYSNDRCSADYDITYKGVGNYCKGL